jgi:putative Ca2+/H+ antiporter (TMEM165/GDT1 family)
MVDIPVSTKLTIIMHSKQFLILGGIVLVLVAILGFVGIIGPTADQSVFGSFWWFDNGENWAHLVLGIVAILAAYVLSAKIQKPLVMLVGILGLFFAVYNVFKTMFMGSNLESPADLVLHLIIGIWALWSAKGSKPAASPSSMPYMPSMPSMPSSPVSPTM